MLPCNLFLYNFPNNSSWLYLSGYGILNIYGIIYLTLFRRIVTLMFLLDSFWTEFITGCLLVLVLVSSYFGSSHYVLPDVRVGASSRIRVVLVYSAPCTENENETSHYSLLIITSDIETAI